MRSAKLTLDDRITPAVTDVSEPRREEYRLGSRVVHFHLSDALDAVLTATNGDVAAAISLIVTTRLKGVPDTPDERLGRELSRFLLEWDTGIAR